MKYLLTTIYDINGTPLSIKCEKVTTAMNIVITNQLEFSDDRQAVEYVNNLRAIWKLPTIKASRIGKRKSIRNKKTGETFTSAAAAARSVGCSTSLMVRHLNRPHVTSNVAGCTFERLDGVE